MIPALALTGGCLLALCQWLIFVYAPIEAEMGLIQKIFYLHFPLAIWALLYFFLVFAGSIVYLARKSEKAALFCRACAEMGVLCCGLALVSGVLWAKKSWGVWWSWDPRLTTTLVMWFIYLIYLLIPRFDLPEHKKSVVQAVLGIVAFLDVPLVFLSARIFRSIHPAVFRAGGEGLPLEMKLVVLTACAALGAFSLGIVLFRREQLCQERRLARLAARRY